MTIEVRNFNELGSQELYDILQLRSEVFVVEQNCVYQDLDGKDTLAVHILGIKNGKLVAYTRIFTPEVLYKEASIGRVIVRKKERKFGYGKEIMEASIKVILDSYGNVPIRISAQTYLLKFYNSLGFVQQGKEYLEDGIPHILMIKK